MLPAPPLRTRYPTIPVHGYSSVAGEVAAERNVGLLCEPVISTLSSSVPLDGCSTPAASTDDGYK